MTKAYEGDPHRVQKENREDIGETIKYCDMRWDSELFNDMVVDPCWQQHERGRPVSDWMVAY